MLCKSLQSTFFLATLFLIAIGSTYYRMHRKNQTMPSDSAVIIAAWFAPLVAFYDTLGMERGYGLYSKAATTRQLYLKYAMKNLKLARILESFCMKRNSAELMASHEDEIKVLHGVRFLTSAGIVWLHVIYFTILSGSVNSRDFENRIPFFGTLLNMNLLVDTFFAISGLLQVKNLLGRKHLNVLLILWKRYVRLIGLLALAILYYSFVVKFHGSGPFWNSYYNHESSNCKKYWWLSLLMLNSSSFTNCYPVTWYIAVDYQYSVLSTLLIYIYQKSKRLALTIFGLAAVISVTIPGVLTYWYRIPAFFYLNIEVFVIHGRDHPHLNYMYYRSYSRAGPYIVGMCLGYLMHIYKPAIYKRSLSLIYSIAGAIFSLWIMIFAVSLGDFFLERNYDALEASIAASFNRSIWAAGVCGIIAICEYGKLPLVSEFLSMPFFVPLSRLSYGMYLIHCLVALQTKRMLTIKAPPIYDSFGVIVDTIGIGTVTLGLSYVLWLILEAPLKKLSDHFVCNRFTSKEVEKSAHTEKNEFEKEKMKVKAA